MNMFDIFSDAFLEKISVMIIKRVDTLLLKIEKRYAIRAGYMSKKNACIYADIATPTLEKWLAKGLPISKIDGSFRIKQEDIDDFIEKHKM